MIVCFAAAAYLNQLVLVPRFLRAGRYVAYFVTLIVVKLTLTGVALAVIRLFCRVVVGPFPAKRWRVDHGIDFAEMLAYVLAATGVVWLFGKATGVKVI